jgi:site-specific recombinase XerD
MATARQPQPQPLFDTLECLAREINPVVDEFLQQVAPFAATEYRLCRKFLLSYQGSHDTYNAYRRDLERFVQWCWLIQKKSLADIGRQDINDYLEFIMEPPHNWIGYKNVRRYVEKQGQRTFNPEWRPFTLRISKAQVPQKSAMNKANFRLNQQSLRALFAVLSTFFSYCQEEEFLNSNPVQKIRQKSRYINKVQQVKVTRKLSELQWQTVIESTEKLAHADPKHERTLFVIAAFYLLGLRISELAETPGRIPVMGDFAPDKHDLWWFTTVGKGNKIRDVAVPDVMLEILKRYRQYRGLSPLPKRNEQAPLVHSERGKSGLGTRQIRNLVQTCFDRAVYELDKNGAHDQAEDLKTATVHWLRHTAISADIVHRPREHIRDDVGHESPATMDKYIDTDRRARHLSARDKQLKK